MRVGVLGLYEMRALRKLGTYQIWYVPPQLFDPLVRGLKYLQEKLYTDAEVVYAFSVVPVLAESAETERVEGGFRLFGAGAAGSSETVRRPLAPVEELVARVTEKALSKLWKGRKVILLVTASPGTAYEYYRGVIEGACRFSLRRSAPLMVFTNDPKTIPQTRIGIAKYLMGVDSTLRDAVIKANLSEEAAEVALALLPTHGAFLTTSVLQALEAEVRKGIDAGEVYYDEDEDCLALSGRLAVRTVTRLASEARPMLRRAIERNVDVERRAALLAQVASLLGEAVSERLRALAERDRVSLRELSADVLIPLPVGEDEECEAFVDELYQAVPAISVIRGKNAKYLTVQSLPLAKSLVEAVRDCLRRRGYDEYASTWGHEWAQWGQSRERDYEEDGRRMRAWAGG